MKVLRLVAGLIVAAVGGMAGVAGPVQAQVSIMALVNDEPITSFDVKQRARLLALSGQGASEKKALEELIDERLQVQEATKRNVSVSESEVETAYAGIAQRSRITTGQLSQALQARGVNPSTLKDRIRAALAWRQVVQLRFRSTIQIREQDVVAALHKRPDDETAKAKAIEYDLKQVIFVLPDKASAAVKTQRRREAEALRSRFTSCANSLEIVKGLRDVAVKDVGKRSTTEMSKELAEKLAAVPIGRLTAPEADTDGVVMVAICDKREISGSSAAEAEVKSELMSEEGEILARRYIRDLRQDAVIEYR